MFHTLTISNPGKALRSVVQKAVLLALKLPRLVFYAGPRVLLTARITSKCAVLMTLLLAPSLLTSLFLSLPSVLFQSPQQNAYYYFAIVLDHDPGRWLPMSFAVLCLLVALAIPASMPRQRISVSY